MCNLSYDISTTGFHPSLAELQQVQGLALPFFGLIFTFFISMVSLKVSILPSLSTLGFSASKVLSTTTRLTTLGVRVA